MADGAGGPNFRSKAEEHWKRAREADERADKAEDVHEINLNWNFDSMSDYHWETGRAATTPRRPQVQSWGASFHKIWGIPTDRNINVTG